jgi:PAS domain S-box-containing protein
MNSSQVQFRTIVESSPEAITAGIGGRYIYLNAAALRLFGANTADELIGQPVLDRIHPDYKQVVLERIRRIERERVSCEPLEQIYLRLDGTPVAVEVYAVPFQADKGPGAVAFIRDISARKAAEAVLRRHAERHDTMLATTGDGFWITDPADARILEVNDAFCRMSGYAREELLRMRIPDIEAAESPEETAQHLRKIIETGFDRFETKHRRQDGTVYEAEILASYWASEKKVLVFQRDITLQKKAEAELARSRELKLALEVSRAVSEAMGMGVVGVDTAHRVLFANPVAEELLDVAEDEMRGRTLDQLVRATNAEGHQLDKLPFWAEVDAGLPFKMEEWTFARRDRSRFPVSLVIAPLSEDVAPTGSVLSFQDISVRKHAQQALLDADRRKNQFLAMLAHELRNPLTPIRNAAFVLGRLGVDEPNLKWAQEVIERQVQHLSRLTDELLDVSRIAQGKIELRKEPIEAGALIAQLTAVAGPMFEARSQSLSVRLPVHPAWLNGDVVRLTQVISNLLDNASKYTQTGGKIEVLADASAHELELKVRDNGPGITADLLPNVFDLFQQGDRTLDRAEGGLGIGLTLVRQLVVMHGGRVFAHSRGSGEGATFTVRLPLTDALLVQSAAASARGAETPAPPCGGRVLLVEDEAAVRDSMIKLLELAGCSIAVAANGAAALEQAESFRPQLVLLDIGLKGMDGFEIARRLRRLPNGNDMVVIAVTGYADEATRRHALESGCDHHVGKPVDPSRLLEMVHNALRQPQHQDRPVPASS